MKSVKPLLITLLCAFATPSFAAPHITEDKSKVVILAYHRVGEDYTPDENISLESFKSHVEDFKSLDYNILPLPELLASIDAGAPLPPRTIAITFEGAYKSAILNAAPLLIDAQIPFTVFYAADTQDQKNPEFASWRDLKRLRQNDNVTLASLPASYDHTAHTDHTAALKSINRARVRHRKKFKTESPYLAYPFGEYTNDLKGLARTQGFKAAFTLDSGAYYHGTDKFSIPRFSITDGFDSIERLRMITNALPLPVFEETPEDTLLPQAPFTAGFSVSDTLKAELTSLSCFVSGQEKPQIEILENRVEIRGTSDDQSRLRLNCTLPGPLTKNDETMWRWYGKLYHRAETNNPVPVRLP